MCVEFIQTERNTERGERKDVCSSPSTHSLTEMNVDSEDDDFIAHSMGAWQALHNHNYKKTAATTTTTVQQ